MKAPERTPENIEIDRLYHQMVTASTPESRRLWAEHYTAAINARNAKRTPEEIAALEREKGLS